jgi:hypothetical protein
VAPHRAIARRIGIESFGETTTTGGCARGDDAEQRHDGVDRRSVFHDDGAGASSTGLVQRSRDDSSPIEIPGHILVAPLVAQQQDARGECTVAATATGAPGRSNCAGRQDLVGRCTPGAR